MSDLARRRLRAQRLSGPGLDSAEAVVGWLGAVQSQDYAGAGWGLGLRAPGLTQAAVDEAFDAGRILRTHVLRPTWHFVLPADARALLDLTGPRVMAGMPGRHRQLEIDGSTIAGAFNAFSRALEGGVQLTRPELGSVLEAAGISPEGQRLAHLIMAAELHGLLISGARRGAAFTYALLEERAAPAPRPSREETLHRLALTYFRSHGPAQVQDFAWWSGLGQREVRAAAATAHEAAELERGSIDGVEYYWLDEGLGEPDSVHLLPNFDEFTVAYRDRSALLGRTAFDPAIFAFGSILSNVLTVGGRVRGAWRRAGKRIELRLLEALSDPERIAVEAEAARLARFCGRQVELVWV